jgi:cyanophycinase
MIGSGCVIAIGGNEEKRVLSASILAEFVIRAGGADARVVIIPSASIEPERRGARYAKIFGKLGAGRIDILHAERGVTPAEHELLRSATGIFVSGGDQDRLMIHLRATGLVGTIREAVAGGAVYAGTSAGAAVVSRLMISGSKRQRANEIIEYGEGLGLVPEVIVDQHFAQRRRLTRLIDAAKTNRLTGVGIDENTAIVWSARGEAYVSGAGEVTIVDPEHRLEDARLRSYRLHVLSEGASYEFERDEEEDDAEEGVA